MEKGIPKKIDQNLLLALCLLLEERSVTKAAVILSQSPPAMSATLRRLREMTGDPLLVRKGNSMLLTMHGETLLPKARAALEGIDRVFNNDSEFDPTKAVDYFSIAATSSFATILLPAVVERLRIDAPNIRLRVRNLGYEEDYEAALTHGHVDLVIGDWPTPPESLRKLPLMRDDVACLLRPYHPAVSESRISPESYCKLAHVSPPRLTHNYHGPVTSQLARYGLYRHVAVEVPEFNMIPFLLMNTDLVFTATRRYCHFWSDQLPLVTMKAPTIFDPIEFYLLWHERAHSSAAHIWMRGYVKRIAKTL